MPIDPSIILSGQRQPDIADQFGRAIQLRALVDQNRLQGMRIEQAQQQSEQNKTLRDLYKNNVGTDGAVNRTGILQGAAAQGLGDRIPELQQSWADADKSRTELALKEFDLNRKRIDATNGMLASLLANPNVTQDDVMQGFADLARTGLITDDMAVRAVRSLPGPDQLRPFLVRKAMESLDIAKQLELQRPQFETIDLGGQVLTGTIDPQTGQFTQGGSLQKTPTPSNKEVTDLKPPQGYRWTESGNLQFIQGGPADPQQGQKSAVATEAERKAATLYQRLKFSEQQLQDALAGAPKAAKPSLLSEAARSFGGDTAANVLTDEGRQRVEAAQLDLLDAALTLGTGAAYTKEQLRGYARSYFPQIGDDDKTVADKQARLQNVIQAARVSAGRAADDVDAQVPGSDAQDRGREQQLPRGDAVPQIRDDNDYAQLPSGAVFIDPNGQRRVKP